MCGLKRHRRLGSWDRLDSTSIESLVGSFRVSDLGRLACFGQRQGTLFGCPHLLRFSLVSHSAYKTRLLKVEFGCWLSPWKMFGDSHLAQALQAREIQRSQPRSRHFKSWDKRGLRVRMLDLGFRNCGAGDPLIAPTCKNFAGSLRHPRRRFQASQHCYGQPRTQNQQL